MIIRILLLVGVLLFLLPDFPELTAQNEKAGPAVIRVEKPVKADEAAANIIVADGFSYYTTQNGLYLIFPKTNNNVKLVALTGQVIWSGELVSGRFYIPTGRGIYFLKVNDKSYKVSCK